MKVDEWCPVCDHLLKVHDATAPGFCDGIGDDDERCLCRATQVAQLIQRDLPTGYSLRIQRRRDGGWSVAAKRGDGGWISRSSESLDLAIRNTLRTVAVVAKRMGGRR